MDAVRSRYERDSVQRYAREPRPHLPAEIFRPAPGRLAWLPVHAAVIAGAAAVVVTGAPWWVALACAVVAGHSWGCLGFLAHETMHHAVTRNRTVEKLVGYAGFGIYGLSPTLWSAWHNQAHHGNTGKPVADPDGFGTLGFWEKSRVVRALTSGGYLTQTQGARDRRQRLLRLTGKGAELEAELSQLQRARFARAYREAGPEAVAGFRQVLAGLLADQERAGVLRLIAKR